MRKSIKEAEKAKSKAKKKIAQMMLDKERALDQMREARLEDEEKMRVLQREREQAQAERDRLQQALDALTKEQQQRAADQEEFERQKNKRLMCLDISDDSIDVSPAKNKQELINEAEEQRSFLLRSHANERQRQEVALRERLEQRSSRRAAGKNKWEEASQGGMAFDHSLPGGSCSPGSRLR